MKISITKDEAEKLLSYFDEAVIGSPPPAEYRINGDDARALAALARLGASVAFESEDTVEKVARVFAESATRAGLKAALADPDHHDEAAALSKYDVERAMPGIIDQTWREFTDDARAAIAALRDSPVSARLAARQPS